VGSLLILQSLGVAKGYKCSCVCNLNFFFSNFLGLTAPEIFYF
jgi:hypothetical protein